MLPPPVLTECDGLTIVRDDLLPGGTKRRVLSAVLPPAAEYVYASPAYVCRDLGAQATVFTAKRALLHPRTREAQQAGAKIVLVPLGYLSNVQAKARAYAVTVGACYLPFGFDTPAMRDALAAEAAALPVQPAEVWSVAGSGTLSRALQVAWPQARCYAVQVGRLPLVGRAHLYQAPEPFERDAGAPPPHPILWQLRRQGMALLAAVREPRGAVLECGGLMRQDRAALFGHSHDPALLAGQERCLRRLGGGELLLHIAPGDDDGVEPLDFVVRGEADAAVATHWSSMQVAPGPGRCCCRGNIQSERRGQA